MKVIFQMFIGMLAAGLFIGCPVSWAVCVLIEKHHDEMTRW